MKCDATPSLSFSSNPITMFSKHTVIRPRRQRPWLWTNLKTSGVSWYIVEGGPIIHWKRRPRYRWAWHRYSILDCGGGIVDMTIATSLTHQVVTLSNPHVLQIMYVEHSSYKQHVHDNDTQHFYVMDSLQLASRIVQDASPATMQTWTTPDDELRCTLVNMHSEHYDTYKHVCQHYPTSFNF